MNEEEKKGYYRELKKLAIPLAMQNLLSALVGATDALMLGRLSQEAVAAVSLANQITFIMSLLNTAVIGAAGVLVAQYWGRKDTLNARRFLSMAIRYTAVISFVFFLLTLLIPEQLMTVFTKEHELIEIGAEHLQIVSFSYLFIGIGHCFLMMMKVTGFAKLSVWISGVIVAVDMSVDLFLVYGLGPAPKLGVAGAAYSTVAVEAIALIWCLIWARGKKDVRPDRETLRFFSRNYEKDLWEIVPGMLVSNFSWGLSATVHALIMGHLGTEATVAFSVTAVARELVQCMTLGLSGGAGIMIGQLLGQNLLEKAKDYGKAFWSVAFQSGLFNIILICLTAPLVYLFYVMEPEAKDYLLQMMAFSAVYMFAFAYNAIISGGVFPAGGDSRYEAVSASVATWCFSVPLALLGCFVFHWPVMAVYIVTGLDEIVRVPFIRKRYSRYLWVKNLTRESAQEIRPQAGHS